MNAVAVPDCGCSVPSVEAPMPANVPTEPMPSPGPTVTNEQPPMPSIVPVVPAEEDKPTPKVDKPSTPAFPSEPESKPEMKPAAPTEEPKPEPAPEPKPAPPANDLFAPEPAPTPMPEPAPATNKPSSGLDDLFGNPATPSPAADPAPAPMPEPAAPAPVEPAKGGLDDLFGNPAAPSTPAPAPEPAKSGLDDLFGNPAAPAPAEAMKSAPADDLFGAPPPATETPASATPAPAANPLDDLFNSAPATPEPAPAPAKNEALDGLFNLNEAPMPKTVEASGETAMPVSTEADSTPNFDNLFGNPKGATETEGKSEANSEAVKKAPEENNFDDLFKSTSAPQQPTFQGAEFRNWIDNTGSYEVKGRLVMIYPDRVRLLKENGKHTTVPFTRLSDSDRQYVNWVAVSLTGSKAKFVATENNGDIAR